MHHGVFHQPPIRSALCIAYVFPLASFHKKVLAIRHTSSSSCDIEHSFPPVEFPESHLNWNDLKRSNKERMSAFFSIHNLIFCYMFIVMCYPTGLYTFSAVHKNAVIVEDLFD